MTAIAPTEIQLHPDQGRAIQTITTAFASDPMCRWCWPDLAQYLDAMPEFTRAFAGAAFPNATAFCTEDYRGVALWLPPGSGMDEAGIDAILQRSIEPQRQAELYQLFEAMGQFHPTERHWYLPLIGVDPAAQSRGYGRRLLQHGLEQCDRDGTIAYLEATSERNIPLYQRHGFQIVGTIQVGSSPPLTPMLREPGGGRSSKPWRSKSAA